MMLSWQTEIWQSLWQAKQAHRMPHALLLTGVTGVGKSHFAEHLLHALLCPVVTAEGHACYTCHSCRLITANTHGNVLKIHPEKPGQAIKIDAIREVSDFIQQTSLQGEYRMVLIQPAHSMNSHAANALLKTLEEPASGALFILISEQPSLLPATILSRCQKISFPLPPAELALAWLQEQLQDKTSDVKLLLKLAHGAPLLALALAEENDYAERRTLFNALQALAKQEGDPLKLANTLTDMDSMKIIDFTLSWMIDVLRLQLTHHQDAITNHDFQSALLHCSLQTQTAVNLSFMHYLQQLRRQLLSGIHLNKLLLLEAIFIRWHDCLREK